MEETNFNRALLNRSLRVFFRNALSITVRNPFQALTFIRTIFWLKKAARVRDKHKLNGYLIPSIIIFSITNKCNLNCKGCYNQSFYSSDIKELSDEKLWQITEEAKELGVSFFVISGGEPFLRPVLLDIMKEYPEIIFLVFTNGTLINEQMIASFKKQKNVVPLISIEGDEEETDERRGQGTFGQLIQTMGQLRKRDIFFGLSLTVTRKNFTSVTSEVFISRFYRLGCKFFLFLEYTPTQEGTEDWVLTDNQRTQMGGMIKYYRSNYSSLFIGVPWDLDDVGGCLSAGRGFVHINAAGDVEPCPFAPFSDTNVRDYSLKDALQSQLFEKIRQIPELSKENGEGCILWKERELVKSLVKNIDT